MCGIGHPPSNHTVGRFARGIASPHSRHRGDDFRYRLGNEASGVRFVRGTASITMNNSSPATARPAHWAKTAALGIVYGDLGTSPLYTLQTVVQAMGGRFTASDALGILSLIVWTLIVTVSIKYCLIVMRADNRGEGGILALMSLIGANSFAPGFKLLTGMGLLGAALIYGDGVITPAISVLSALEGVNVVTA